MLQASTPVNTSPEEYIVKIAQGVTKDLGLNDSLIGYKQASDGGFFTKQKMPTIIIGPSDPKVGHSSNEHLLLDDLITATKIYALIAVRTLAYSYKKVS